MFEVLTKMPKPTDLLQGTLDLLILKTIAREPLHGWRIAKRIQILSNDTLSVEQMRKGGALAAQRAKAKLELNKRL